jgi:hypothetical protein
MPSPGWIVLKAFVYFGVVALGAKRWGATLNREWLRVLLAGLSRFALGWIVGIPAGFLLRDRLSSGNPAGFYALYFTLRFLLWLLVLRVAFLKAPIREVVGLAALGALVNAALDVALPESLFEAFYVNFC